MNTLINLYNSINPNESNLTGRDVANMVYELYNSKIVCTNIRERRWYEFKDHRWFPVYDQYHLFAPIFDNLKNVMGIFCSQKLIEATHMGSYEKCGNLTNSINKLETNSFRRCVVTECATKFYDESFLQKLDSNPYLLGFCNGVYDLKNGLFRNGSPGDYVSMTVGYDYKECTNFERIYELFSQWQTDPVNREDLLISISGILDGLFKSTFHVWEGPGGNGKSSALEFLHCIFGAYFGTISTKPLTGYRNKDRLLKRQYVNQELVNMSKKRLIVVQEPAYNDVLYPGRLMEMSGGDTMQAQFVMTCNVNPTIVTDGTTMEVKTTIFDSEFNDDPKDTQKQFLSNHYIDEEFSDHNLIQSFMWLLINKYYPIYLNSNRKVRMVMEEQLEPPQKRQKI